MANDALEVKARVDIVDLVREYVPLKQAGRHFKARCPFHNEKTPSFVVSQEIQMYKCFGCGRSGDVYEFLKEHEGMEFREALVFLADRVNYELTPLGRGSSEDTNVRKQVEEAHQQALKLFNYILTKHTEGREALSYLTKERGLKLETIGQFQLGFAPDKNILEAQLRKKGFSKSQLIASGLMVETRRGAMDRFAGRIIFPIFDYRGKPVAFSGRATKALEEKGLAKYINSPETVLYHKSNSVYGLPQAKDAIRRSKVVVLVEGEFDAISPYQAGIQNVVAIKGTSLTPGQVRLLSRLADEFIFAFDADRAGTEAILRSIDTVQEFGVVMKVASLGNHKDPDEFARKDIDRFRRALSVATDVWQFAIDNVFSRYDRETGGGAAKISRAVTPILGRIADEIVRAHYASRVAQRLGVPVEAVLSQISPQKRAVLAENGQVPRHNKPRRELLEEQLFSLLITTDPPAVKDIEITFESQFIKKVHEHYLEFVGSGEFDLASFVRSLPPELSVRFGELVIERESLEVSSVELRETREELEKLILKDELSAIAAKIAKLEEAGDREKLEEAQTQFARISRKVAEYQAT